MSRRSTAPGRPRPHFAPCDTGLEAALAAELATFPEVTEIVPDHRGVAFWTDRRGLWRVNLESHLATRVLLPLAEFPVRNRQDLYRGALNIGWADWLSAKRTIAVDARGTLPELHHAGFVAQVVKDAICDSMRAETGARPSVNREQPDVAINVHLEAERCRISLDASGARLFRRGWRTEAGAAPLKETLAAGVLRLSGWQPGEPLLDPMCGAGTLLIEAALMASDRAPGLTRLGTFGEGFAFERWLDHDVDAFNALVAALKARIKPVAPDLLFGSDADEKVVAQAERNLRRAGLEGAVRFRVAGVDTLTPPTEQPGTMVCNPPYAVRLGEVEEVAALYATLGDTLKQRFNGWTAWLLVADEAPIKAIGLKPKQRLPLRNGSLTCRLCSYPMFKGPPPDRRDRA